MRYRVELWHDEYYHVIDTKTGEDLATILHQSDADDFANWCEGQTMDLEEACTILEELVRDGWEYPDAEWEVAKRTKLSSDDLRAEYDRRCVLNQRRT